MSRRFYARRKGVRSSRPMTLLSLLLSFALVSSLAPMSIWASEPPEANEVTSIAEEMPADKEVVTPTVPEAPDTPAQEEEAPASPNPDVDVDDASTSKDAALTENEPKDEPPAPSATKDEDDTQADPVDKDEATEDASGQDDATQSLLQMVRESVAKAAQEPDAQIAPQATGLTLADASFASISQHQTPSSPAPYSATMLDKDETLYAHAWTSGKEHVDDDGTWSYQWLYGSGKKANDFQPIAGQTSSTLQLTDSFRTQFDGKYLRVCISNADTSVEGPKAATKYTTLTACGFIVAPIVTPEQIKLDHVLISKNGAGFGDSLEDAPDCNVGDTLEAAAYDMDDPYTLYDATKVDFSWQAASSADGPFAEVATGATLTVGESLSGKFLKVVATAKSGVEGHDTCESPVGTVLPAGVTNLYRVEILNASSVKTLGSKLVAQAYKGDYWDNSPVTNDVTYTWRWTSEKPTSSFDDSRWHVIEGVTGPELVVPDYLEGCWISVTAYAGDNTVASSNSSAAGPFRKPGSHELIYAALSQTPEDDTFTFWTGRTIGVTAREATAAGTAGAYLDASQLNCTWLVSDSFDGTYTELADGNAHKTSFVIPDSYAGKYLKCRVDAGFNVMEAGPMRKAIALGEGTQPVEPVDPVGPEQPVMLDVSLRVVGVTPHGPGAAYQQMDWIPLTSRSVSSSARLSAWDLFAAQLDAAGYFYNLNGGCPYSITSPDRTQTLAMSSSAPWSYWSFLINGEYASSMPSGYYPKDGDVLELVYVDASGTLEKPVIPVDPDAPVADWEADWATFGSGTGKPVEVETSVAGLEGSWTYDYARGAFASWSEPVVAGGFVFLTSGNKLLKLDAQTGSVIGSTTLAASTAYGCRPVYARGMVIVPLDNGRLQAVSALGLQTRWLTAALPDRTIESPGGGQLVSYSQQSLSTITVSGDNLYAFTAEADWSQTYGGYALCVDVNTGAIRWVRENKTAGYYWAGAAQLNGFMLVAGDDGRVESISTDSPAGIAAGALDLGCAVRSTVVSADGYAYVVTTNGVLHKIAVGSDGQPREVASLAFGDYSTSSPSIADGIIYVGGSKDGRGILAVIDASTMKPLSVVDATQDAAFPGEVKSTPILVRDQNGVMALFTCNGATGTYPDYTGGGGVYAYRLGDTHASLAFDPPAGMHNYSMASLAYANGRFYYVNDSGNLFALKLATASDDPKPIDPIEPDDPAKPVVPNNPNTPANPPEELLSPSDDTPMASRTQTSLPQAPAMGTIVLTAPPATAQQAVPAASPAQDAATDGSTEKDDMPAGATNSALLWISIIGLVIALALVISGLRRRSHD